MFMSPPPRVRERRLSGGAQPCSPSPGHGLNVLAAMSSELGPRLATPLSKRESNSESGALQITVRGSAANKGKVASLPPRCHPADNSIARRRWVSEPPPPSLPDAQAFHGVTFHQTKQKYLSRLSLPDGQYANLGYHEDSEQAAAAYDCAAYSAKGSQATLNFRHPQGGPARNSDLPSPTSQPGGLIGRRVECRDPEDGGWEPGVIIAYAETTVSYTVKPSFSSLSLALSWVSHARVSEHWSEPRCSSVRCVALCSEGMCVAGSDPAFRRHGGERGATARGRACAGQRLVCRGGGTHAARVHGGSRGGGRWR